MTTQTQPKRRGQIVRVVAGADAGRTAVIIQEPLPGATTHTVQKGDEMNTGNMNLIARCQGGCGRIIFAVANEPLVLRACRRDIMRLLSDGYAIEQVTSEAVRSGSFGCKCPKAPQAEQDG